MMIKYIQAEFLKMRKFPVVLAHLLIPVIVSVVFLAYYSGTSYSEESKVEAFFETLGFGLPILIGIFAACIAELEENAGELQNLLTHKNKTKVFSAKLIALLILEFCMVMTATLIFGTFFCRDEHVMISFSECALCGIMMWAFSISIYIWQLIFAFSFGKEFSIGAGIVSGLICVLFLTGMGEIVWKYTPSSWTGRIPYTYLQSFYNHAENASLHSVALYCIIFTVVSFIVFWTWSSNFSGRRG